MPRPRAAPLACPLRATSRRSSVAPPPPWFRWRRSRGVPPKRESAPPMSPVPACPPCCRPSAPCAEVPRLSREAPRSYAVTKHHEPFWLYRYSFPRALDRLLGQRRNPSLPGPKEWLRTPLIWIKYVACRGHVRPTSGLRPGDILMHPSPPRRSKDASSTRSFTECTRGSTEKIWVAVHAFRAERHLTSRRETLCALSETLCRTFLLRHDPQRPAASHRIAIARNRPNRRLTPRRQCRDCAAVRSNGGRRWDRL